jgi:hypothetical protein
MAFLMAAAVLSGLGSVRRSPGAIAATSAVGQLNEGRSSGEKGLSDVPALINPANVGALASRNVNGPARPNCAHSVLMMLV